MQATRRPVLKQLRGKSVSDLTVSSTDRASFSIGKQKALSQVSALAKHREHIGVERWL